MKLGFLFITIIMPVLAFGQWTVFRDKKKNDIYETYLVTRHVKLGKAERLAAIIQNSRVSSEIIPAFKKSQPDDVAKYLLKHYGSYQKEKMEGVSLYRAESPTDHVRLMVKKRKNDFLVSFAMVKRSFLYRSYNETDFLQRLFIAEENMKSGERKEAFHFLFPSKAYAAGSPLSPDDLINAISNISVNVDPAQVNNLVNAAQGVAPAINNVGTSINGVSGSINGVSGSINNVGGQLGNVSNSINGLSSSVDRASSGATQGMQGIERQMGRFNNTITDGRQLRKSGFNLGLGAGFGLGVGMMGANLLATVGAGAIHYAKDFLYDIVGWYKDGEEQSQLKEGLMALDELEGLQEKTNAMELQIQSLDIALQLASGRSVEQLFTQRTQMALPTKNGGKPEEFCESPMLALGKEKLDQLRQLGEAIKNDKNLQAQLCQKLNNSMEALEQLSTQMTVARSKLMGNILVVANNAMEAKQKSLSTPEAVKKAVNKCENLVEGREKLHTQRFKSLNCSSQGDSSECLALQKILTQNIPHQKTQCQKDANSVMQTFNDNYVEVASSIEDLNSKSQNIMQDFLKAECRAEERKESCKDINGNFHDGELEKAKKRYREMLADINASGCPLLKKDRFQPRKEILAGEMRRQQDTLPQQAPTEGNSSARSTASSSSGGNMFTAIGGFFKSIWNWFF